MVDVVLIVLPAVFAVLVLLAAVYFLVYFQHPDDKWVAWLPKVTVVLGVALTIYDVLLLPMDVANQGGEFNSVGGLPMGVLTESFFIITVIMAVAVVPFTMFYYEGLDEKDEYDSGNASKQVFYAVKWTSVTITVFLTAVLVLWYTIGYADINSDIQTSSFSPGRSVLGNYCPQGATVPCEDLGVSRVGDPEPYVGFIMYTVAIASLIGWVLFAFFGGVGLPSLPFDLLMEYQYRPRPIKLQEYTDKKRLIGEQAALLLQASAALTDEMKAAGKSKKGMASSRGRKLKTLENEFKRDVLFLESQWKKLDNAYKNGGGSAVLFFFKMIVGLVGSFLSLFWLLHIVLFVLPMISQPSNPRPISYFLNTFFDNVSPVPVFGIVFYGIFVFWLMACVIKGVTKMGVRFLFIEVHPMKIGETMMSSMVFNVGVMLFCSLAVTQFCTFSFQFYARYTAAFAIFGNQIGSLRYISYIYSILIYILPIMSVLTFAFMWARPHDQKIKQII